MKINQAAHKDMIRSDGSGSPWRRCSFTKSTSAREATAFPGERATIKMGDGGGVEEDNDHDHD